jgi:hypothetical protein
MDVVGPARTTVRPKSRFLLTFQDGTGLGWTMMWRRGGDSNPRYGCPYAAFRVRCIQPLCHLSVDRVLRQAARRVQGRRAPSPPRARRSVEQRAQNPAVPLGAGGDARVHRSPGRRRGPSRRRDPPSVGSGGARERTQAHADQCSGRMTVGILHSTSAAVGTPSRCRPSPSRAEHARPRVRRRRVQPPARAKSDHVAS